MEAPMLEQFVKNCTPWEELTLEEFVGSVSYGRGPLSGAGEECEESCPEEEGVAKTVCDEQIAAPVSCPHTLLGWRRERNQEKLSLGRRECWQESFKICRYFFLA
ncbi:hypothetical protein WISP_78595 [Willisornis vidua]|uniref:Uncharacterized protein n=1 Tax=Willisornis vidua TaxID=1566151 RepID=A0ABQ9DAU6_9PASS|nr:hypothetical protein WISP_78595 [Willisornis vidua]